MPLTGNDIILTLCRKYISPGKEIKGHIIEPLEELKIQQKEAFCFHAAYQHQTEFPSVQFFLLFFSDRSPVAVDERSHYPGCGSLFFKATVFTIVLRGEITALLPKFRSLESLHRKDVGIYQGRIIMILPNNSPRWGNSRARKNLVQSASIIPLSLVKISRALNTGAVAKHTIVITE